MTDCVVDVTTNDNDNDNDKKVLECPVIQTKKAEDTLL